MTNPMPKNTTLRVAVDYVELCLLLDLFESLGGVQAGRSYSSCLQQLLIHILTSQERAGVIKRVSGEEAFRRVAKTRTDLTGDVSLDLFNTPPALPPEKEAEITSRIDEQLRKQDAKGNEDLLDIFSKNPPLSS